MAKMGEENQDKRPATIALHAGRSVILKPAGETAVDAFFDTVTVFGMGASWGGFESLVIPFDPTRYRTATRWNAEGSALRFHIGLEDEEDLKTDLECGLAALRAAG